MLQLSVPRGPLARSLLGNPRPVICGIINTTPDSFSDGGFWLRTSEAVSHGLTLVGDGAGLLDIGGESTRPGAAPVSLSEELDRVIPVVTELARRTDVPLSVDTSRPEVMREAVAAGASMINDVRALQLPGALDTTAELGVPVCLMHMNGEPPVMQQDVKYGGDVVDHVRDFLSRRRAECVSAGVRTENIILDPGFGFGKTAQHNFQLLQRLGSIAGLGAPVLVGLSRKSMIGHATGTAVGDREFGSVVAAVLAVQNGAAIVRVHNVKATAEGLAVLGAVAQR